jgi:hypothetical protein
MTSLARFGQKDGIEDKRQVKLGHGGNSVPKISLPRVS